MSMGTVLMLALLGARTHLSLVVAVETGRPVQRHIGRWESPPRKCPSSMVTDGPLLGNGDMGAAIGGSLRFKITPTAPLSHLCDHAQPQCMRVVIVIDSTPLRSPCGARTRTRCEVVFTFYNSLFSRCLIFIPPSQTHPSVVPSPNQPDAT